MPDNIELVDDKPKHLILTLEEAKALQRVFMNQFHPYEDIDAHDAMRKIVRFTKEAE